MYVPHDRCPAIIKPCCGHVLLVGDGDFSFTASMLKFGTLDPAQVTTSSLETAQTIQQHKLAADNMQALTELGVTVHLETDARYLHTHLALNKFHYQRIVFNFPLADRHKIKSNRALLADFFYSCSQILSAAGQVMVTLCRGQGGTPADQPMRLWHDSWQVQSLAANSGFIMRDVEPFDASIYVGYHSVGFRFQDKSFHTDAALTHIFELADLVPESHHSRSQTRLTSRPDSHQTRLTSGRNIFSCPHYVAEKMGRNLLEEVNSPVCQLKKQMEAMFSQKLGARVAPDRQDWFILPGHRSRTAVCHISDMLNDDDDAAKMSVKFDGSEVSDGSVIKNTHKKNKSNMNGMKSLSCEPNHDLHTGDRETRQTQQPHIKHFIPKDFESVYLLTKNNDDMSVIGRVGVTGNDRVGVEENDRVGMMGNDKVCVGGNDKVGVTGNDRVGVGESKVESSYVGDSIDSPEKEEPSEWCGNKLFHCRTSLLENIVEVSSFLFTDVSSETKFGCRGGSQCGCERGCRGGCVCGTKDECVSGSQCGCRGGTKCRFMNERRYGSLQFPEQREKSVRLESDIHSLTVDRLENDIEHHLTPDVVRSEAVLLSQLTNGHCVNRLCGQSSEMVVTSSGDCNVKNDTLSTLTTGDSSVKYDTLTTGHHECEAGQPLKHGSKDSSVQPQFPRLDSALVRSMIEEAKRCPYTGPVRSHETGRCTAQVGADSSNSGQLPNANCLFLSGQCCLPVPVVAKALPVRHEMMFVLRLTTSAAVPLIHASHKMPREESSTSLQEVSCPTQTHSSNVSLQEASCQTYSSNVSLQEASCQTQPHSTSVSDVLLRLNELSWNLQASFSIRDPDVSMGVRVNGVEHVCGLKLIYLEPVSDTQDEESQVLVGFMLEVVQDSHRMMVLMLELDAIACCVCRIPDSRLVWSQSTRFQQQFHSCSTSTFPHKFSTFSLHPLKHVHDLSFWLAGSEFDDDELCSIVRDVAGDHVVSVHLVDSYLDPASGKHSRCYRLVFMSYDLAFPYLTSWKLQANIRLELAQRLGITLR